MAYQPWHDWKPEVDDVYDVYKASPTAANKAALVDIVGEALNNGGRMKTIGSMFVETNQQGRSFSCMSQGDCAYTMMKLGIGIKYDPWFEIGVRALRTNQTQYRNGGLCLPSDSGTFWYCGQTADHQKDTGGTLNKHLMACRTFIDCARFMSSRKNTAAANEYYDYARKGLYQLMRGDLKLEHFFVLRPNGNVYTKAWMYYACGNAKKGREYYLDENYKNAQYHIYCMRLIYAIAKGCPGIDWTMFQKKTCKIQNDLDMSPLKVLWRIYKNKIDDAPIGTSSQSICEYGEFGGTLNDYVPLSATELAFFATFP